ncbi:MAG: hypothetical protein WCI93_01485 [bacterium]
MSTLIFGLIGLTIGALILIIKESIYMPGPRKIQAIMKFDKLYDIIENIEGKKIYKGENLANGTEKWDLIDGDDERLLGNIHFFLWPFCKLYTYPLTYTKEKNIGEEEEGDLVIWKDDKTKMSIISRTGISDHLEYRVGYPTINSNLETEELAHINTYTNNILEVRNAAKAFFGIKNSPEIVKETLHGGLRGLVSKKKLHDLNEYSSEERGKFNTEMQGHSNLETPDQTSLPSIGMYLFKSIFKDFNPADSVAEKLMESFTAVTIAEETGKAKVVAAQKDVEVATEKAKAYEIEQAPILKWKKKNLIDTGLARTDAAGNIIELLPDANTRVGAEAMKEWAKLTGTLVIDSGTVNKIFSIPTPNKKEEN